MKIGCLIFFGVELGVDDVVLFNNGCYIVCIVNMGDKLIGVINGYCIVMYEIGVIVGV